MAAGPVRSARETVNVQVYIFESDGIGRQFLEALEERARAGVEVRLLVDAFGSLALDREWRRRLEAAGYKVSRFRPFNPFTLIRVHRRDHRRAIVVDGSVAFTGGGAIADKWLGHAQDPDHWRDNMVEVEGPLAAGIQAAFAQNWTYATGEVLAGERFFPPVVGVRTDAAQPPAADSAGREAGPAGPLGVAVASSPSEATQPLRLLYWLTFKGAQRRLYVANSYFIPGQALLDALKERAGAGVDVRLLLPGARTDAKPVWLAGRLYYAELLEAGVRIYEYQPTMMHAKAATADGIWSVIGSANLDARSTELNEENEIGIADSALGRAVEEGFLADLARSREIRLEEWKRRSILERIGERLSVLLVEQY